MIFRALTLSTLLSCLIGTSMNANFTVIYELSSARRDELHQLYKQHWWTNTRTRADIDIILDHSLSIGLIDDTTDTLIGFTRIVSDHFKYAFIFDVMLDGAYRGKGLGRILMETALNHAALQRVTVFELHCHPDMVAFYEKFGFKEDFENVKALRLTRALRASI